MNAQTPFAVPQPLPRERLAGLAGHEILSMMLAGDLPIPPFSPTTRIVLAEVAPGRIVFTGTPDWAFLNPMGTVHGGWIATILDSAMGCAVHSVLKPGQLYTTTSMNVNYVRALTAESGEARCEAVTTHHGSRLVTSEGKLFDAKGRLIAHGSETCMVLDL